MSGLDRNRYRRRPLRSRKNSWLSRLRRHRIRILSVFPRRLITNTTHILTLANAATVCWTVRATDGLRSKAGHARVGASRQRKRIRRILLAWQPKIHNQGGLQRGQPTRHVPHSRKERPRRERVRSTRHQRTEQAAPSPRIAQRSSVNS